MVNEGRNPLNKPRRSNRTAVHSPHLRREGSCAFGCLFAVEEGCDGVEYLVGGGGGERQTETNPKLLHAHKGKYKHTHGQEGWALSVG